MLQATLGNLHFSPIPAKCSDIKPKHRSLQIFQIAYDTIVILSLELGQILLTFNIELDFLRLLTKVFRATLTISCRAKPVLFTAGTPKHMHPAAISAVSHSGRAVSLLKVYG
jgi:hypothetical protein